MGVTDQGPNCLPVLFHAVGPVIAAQQLTGARDVGFDPGK